MWWSRYWPYTAEDLMDIAHAYAEHSLPIDTLVSDMAWHYHNETRIDWGGYTWSPELFPTPNDFLSTLEANNLNTVLNLHLQDVQYGVDTGYLEFGENFFHDII